MSSRADHWTPLMVVSVPAQAADRGSETAIVLLFAAALAVWLIYALMRRRRPGAALDREVTRPPSRSVKQIGHANWHVFDEEGQLLFSGDMQQCEAWLDREENQRRLKLAAARPLRWNTTIVRAPVGAAYVVLAALRLSVSFAWAFGRRMLTSDRASFPRKSTFFAREIRLAIGRTGWWMRRDVPAPWKPL